MTTHFAAAHLDTGAVHGIGTTAEGAMADARRELSRQLSDEEVAASLASLTVVPCTEAAHEFLASAGGAPTRTLTVSRVGVMLRSEEE